MSYLVLARKWRPQAFDDVTGQEHVVRTLANAIAQGRVAHALLLCGPRGVGKTTTARLLARALNCESGPTSDPCGTCQPCREITQGSSVDVVEIDGASNNSVDNVREIRETVRYLPQRDRNKVFIIDEVHMLSTAAFNALLKTLEEPPPHVKFIFATTDPQKLPDTILSRCQRHNFRRVPASKMVGRLRTICDQEGITISDRILALISKQADGGMRDSLSLLDQLVSSVGLEVDDRGAEEALGLVDSAVVFSMADALLERDGRRIVEGIEEVYERGVDPKKLCEELAQHLRDLIFTKSLGKAPRGGGEEEAKALVAQAGKADAAQLTRLFDLVHGAIRNLSFAAQPRMALEVALLSAVHLAPGQGLADLAARLENLTAGGSSGGGGGGLPPSGASAPGRAAPRQPAQQAAPQRQEERPRQETRQAEPPGRQKQPAPATSAADLVRQVEAMAGMGTSRQPRSKAAPRGGVTPSADDEEPHARTGAAPPRAWDEPPPPREAPPAWSEPASHGEPPPAWDEPPPHGDDDLPGAFSEAPSRTFPMDAPPGGCATADCGEEPGGGEAGRDDPALPPEERWRRFLEGVRVDNPVLYPMLAEGRLSWIRPGEIAVGFGAEHGFHRAQIESGDFRRQAEEVLSLWFGAGTRLRLDAVATGAPVSVAEGERKRREDRAARLRTEAREHPAVRAVQSILGGEILGIDVSEDR